MPRSRTRRRRTPSAAASGMPCTLPLGEVSGRFRSPCASIQSAAPGPCDVAIPPSVPIAIEWSPPSTSGSEPCAGASPTSAARRSHACEDRRRGSARAGRPSSVASGTGARERRRVGHLAAELADPRLELGVADRRRPHVDAAAAGAEVEPGPDDRDALHHVVRAHCRRNLMPPSSRRRDRPGRARRAAVTPKQANRSKSSWLRHGRSRISSEKVARAGLEPATPRFSAVCSTN